MFQRFTTLLLAAALAGGTSQAFADIGVRFIEGAPKDRFEITNLGACAVVATDVVIDLRGSAAGLVFDITGTGAGVEVFQPFELVAGGDALASHSRVVDGDRQVTLSVRRLAPAARRAVFPPGRGAGEDAALPLTASDRAFTARHAGCRRGFLPGKWPDAPS